jgi:hypothetical protein
MANQRGESEWEPIKILLKELGLCPKVKSRSHMNYETKQPPIAKTT